jgi:hypothetical protein
VGHPQLAPNELGRAGGRSIRAGERTATLPVAILISSKEERSDRDGFSRAVRTPAVLDGFIAAGRRPGLDRPLLNAGPAR